MVIIYYIIFKVEINKYKILYTLSIYVYIHIYISLSFSCHLI